MTVLTAGVFTDWSGGALHGRPTATLGNPSIDTRTLEKNDCFFALRGPNFDGHAFVNQALVAGASTLVVERAHCSSIVTAAATFDATVIGVESTAKHRKANESNRRQRKAKRSKGKPRKV